MLGQATGCPVLISDIILMLGPFRLLILSRTHIIRSVAAGAKYMINYISRITVYPLSDIVPNSIISGDNRINSLENPRLV